MRSLSHFGLVDNRRGIGFALGALLIVVAQPVGAAAVVAPGSLGHTPFGQIDSVATGPGSVSFSGWSLDPDSSAPTIVQMYIDGTYSAMASANQSRPDVANAYPGAGANHGYSLTAPAAPGTHWVCMYAVNIGPGTSAQIDCDSVLVQDPHMPFGQIDSITTGAGTISASGWSADPDTSAPTIVQMYIDGAANAMTLASQPRPDVANAYPWAGANHGYSLTMPAAVGTHWVCLYAINIGIGNSAQMDCRSAVVRS